MASHRADHARSYNDDRGGGRYAAPRRNDRREGRERDRDNDRDRDRADRRRDERRYDRPDRSRERNRERDNYRVDRRRDERHEERRDERRPRDSYRRRSRSPRDRSRERSRDRYRDNRRTGHDDRQIPRARDDRYSPRDPPTARAGNSYGSGSAARELRDVLSSHANSHSSDARPDSKGSNLSQLSREDWKRGLENKKREDEKKKKLEKEALAKDKLERLAKWKQALIMKRKGLLPDGSPATGSPTTSSVASPAPAGQANDNPKSKAPSKTNHAKEFRLDPSATTRPAQFKSATAKTGDASAGQASGQAAKANANVGVFGLKVKPTDGEVGVGSSKKGILDDEEHTINGVKHTLNALPDFTTPAEGAHASSPADANEDDTTDSADEASARAQLEKRREDLAKADIQMEDATPVAESSGEAMDVDNAKGVEADDIDPLDAFMADLSESKPAPPAFQGQTMFGDDLEPEETAVDSLDLVAMTTVKKKKKNEIPTVDHSRVDYGYFRKNFYKEPAEVSAMTPEEVADLRLELDGIKVKPSSVPRPVLKWAQMGLLQPTMDVFNKLRYEKPTPIQAQAIPIIESGMDLTGIAKTGSGKTLAFGIPMIRHILDQPALKPSDGPIALILAPTRELSSQIVAECKPFLKASNLNMAVACGGQPISEHIAMIKRGGIHVLCATAGRLIELLGSNNGRVLSLKRITYVVLDEADRMFDMGFEPQVIKILDSVRPDRQTILFSATMPKNMAALARRVLTRPAEVTVGGRSTVAPEVDQVIQLVPNKEVKFKELLRRLGILFQNDEDAQVLIFVERQESADELLAQLVKSKYGNINTIHGGRDQTDRSEAIDLFKRGILQILIATSVAARGLDVPNLAMVFNYDCPTHLEDYVHRCGRTGRAGKTGTAITLIENPAEEHFAYFVIKALKQSGKPVDAELEKMSQNFYDKIKRGEAQARGSGFGGKGLDRLDAARAIEKRREKRAHRIEGEDVSDDEPEVPLPKATDGAKTAAADNSSKQEPEYMRILQGGIAVNKTERTVAGPSKPLTAKERAMAAANKVDGRLSKKGTIHFGQPIDNKGPDAGVFHATVTINDFPQEARWGVTNRTNVVKILDATGVSITTKGNYYPEGKEPGPDDPPKLYILVEGDTENAVQSAMRELYQHLSEGVRIHEEKAATRPVMGRYTV